MESTAQRAYETLMSSLEDRGIDAGRLEDRLRSQRIETPSWGYGNSGTRFKVFPQRGVPRDPFEKISDAAEVHRLTGVCPSVAIHIPWDRVDDYAQLKERASSLGVRIGSEVLSLWFADGTNYAGQDSFRERRARMRECLAEAYGAMPDNMRMLLEYKPFEPAFYHTDLPDWGAALTMCQKLGERAEVLVDLGHHLQGTNIEHIVALLLDEGRLGGFHFNNRKYADDDLIVGSVNPFELFLIYTELVEAEETGARIDYMIDQAHNIEPKLEAMILSVTNLQEAYAKALLVDREALREAQRAGDVLGGHRVLLDAYSTDVRPLCAKVREDLGGSAEPVAAFRTSGYLERVMEERKEGAQAGWG